MRSVALGFALMMTALPAAAGGLSIELPNLTWPEAPTATLSTQNCTTAVETTTTQTQKPACK